MDILRLAGYVAVGGAIFFLVEWLTTRSELSAMTKVERAQAQIREDERKRARRTPKQWLLAQLHDTGYRGDPAPIVLALGFAYLGVAVLLTMLGLDALVAMLVAVPGVLGVAYAGRTMWWARRRRSFAFQLKQLFDLLRGQLEAGYGTQRAMEMVVPNLPDPLRSEFQVALDSTRAGKDLMVALGEVREAYPSRGFDLFIAALEVDREQGGSLAQTLQRAAGMLQREFDLAQQSSSELAQSKQTFYGVLAILGFITGMSIFGGDETARDAYFSPVGLTVLTALFANAAWGCWRVLSIMRSAGGDV